MPDYFSHIICAQKIYEKLKRETKAKITDDTLYYLGAQGGDVFFAYKLNWRYTNLGRRLHVIDPYELFSELVKGDFSYAAGFATHYALDCMLHPAVYAFEATIKSPMAHARIENDLGLFISRKYAVQRKILQKDRVMAATFTVYDCIEKIEPTVTVTGVERCLKRHFSYTRTLLKTKKQTYRFNLDYASLSGAVDDSVSFGAELVEAISSGELIKSMFSRSFLQK